MIPPPKPNASSRPATSLDVARRAGVSRTTVSYILNDTPGVSFAQSTREAVRRAAEELNYRPNLLARSLVSNTGPIVIVMPRLPQNEVTSMRLAEVTTALFQHGFISVVVQVHDDVDMAFESIVSFHPQAAVFATDTWGELVDRLESASIKVIGLWVRGGSDSFGKIGAAQVSHLRERGHTRIAFADAAEAGQIGTPARRAEVEDACRQHGMVDPLVAVVGRNGNGAEDAVRAWHEDGITAVCAFNDEVAYAVLFGIRAAGLRCPEDIAVIGCDDLPASAVAYPPLTSISFDQDLATKLVLWWILDGLGQNTVLPTGVHQSFRVVARESTR